ncbi:unnamed protein product, partial [Rotaria sordida]
GTSASVSLGLTMIVKP